MTREQALINIEKELKCRKDEVNCNDFQCNECPGYVSYEDLTDTLQTLHDWIRAERRTDD